MEEHTLEPVLHSFAYGLDFLREQLADVHAPDMVAQPNDIMNHPSWVVGHLTFACQLLGGMIGVDEWLSSDWAARFGPGSLPVADVSRYETKDDAMAILREAQFRITRAVKQLDDTKLDQPFPDESYLEVFPTVRHALTQVLVGHTGYHVGQVAMWRKAMGFPRIGRSFE